MGAVALVAMPVLVAGRLWGRQAASAQTTTTQQQKTNGVVAAPASVPAVVSGGSAAAQPGVLLDRLVAVVNGDVILESDVDEERRFGEVQP